MKIWYFEIVDKIKQLNNGRIELMKRKKKVNVKKSFVKKKKKNALKRENVYDFFLQ